MADDLRAASTAAGTAKWDTRRWSRGRGGDFARTVRRSLCALLCGLAFWVGHARAQAPPQTIFNVEQRNEAIRAIPFDALGDADQARLASVVSNPTMYRRLPVQTVECEPDLFMFLVRYPEVVVNIWQVMDITKVQVSRKGPFTFDANDGAGTTSRVELIYGRPELHVFYAEGAYEGPLLRNRVTGSCVVLLRSAYSNQDGHSHVTSSLDVFAKLDQIGAEIVVKTLYPVVGKAVDFNFVETTKFVGQVCLASQRNGPGMQRLASRLTNIAPEVRQEFTRHTDTAYQRALLRHAAATDPLTAAQPAAPDDEPPPAASSEASAAAEPVAPRRHTAMFRR
jgi:hypothetical protein